MKQCPVEGVKVAGREPSELGVWSRDGDLFANLGCLMPVRAETGVKEGQGYKQQRVQLAAVGEQELGCFPETGL